MKKLASLLLACILAVTALALTSCGNVPRTQKDYSAKITAGTPLKIGIIQYMSHPSLDNCYNGIVSALNDSGLAVDIDRQTGSSTAADSDCLSFAMRMVAEDYDLIIAIATPAAQSAYSAAGDTNIPVIFCAVSDPEAAKLVETNQTPGDLCSGTSDVLDLSAQLDLITSIQPDVETIGILYTSSEANSISNLARFRALATARGIAVEASAVQSSADIPSAAATLAGKVDCINNFTDNNVVNNLSVVLSAANNAGIPVYGSEVEQVKNGCLAAASIDYVALGKTTGEMAVEVLNGTTINTLSVKTIAEATPAVNEGVAKDLSLTIPKAVLDAAEIYGQDD